jgi:hypothetical protein
MRLAGATPFGLLVACPVGCLEGPYDEVPPEVAAVLVVDALVRVSDPGPGSLDAVSRIAPLIATSDFPTLHFESVPALEPATPDPTKTYRYFTLPASLVALESLGVSCVSIGNHHAYDYLERGLMDTRATLDAAGIGYSGAGRNPEEAFLPWRTEVGGLPLSFIGASSVSGAVYVIRYNASDTQGGAADLSDSDRARAAIEGERALGRLAIVQLHTGVEYTVSPTDYTRNRLDLAAESGAAIVVGHHPHVAQGFSVHAGGLQVHSLGNFTFDQDRHETMLELVVLVDLDSTRERHVVAYPIYLEDYRPRLAVGPIADADLRRIAQYSDPSVSSELEAGRVLVARTADAPAPSPRTRPMNERSRLGV